MYFVKFCRAPSQYWVGCTVYKNATYFSSGRTLDELVSHVKQRLYQVGRVPASAVLIESQQSLPSEMPTEKMTKIFKSKFWYPRDNKPSSVSSIIEEESDKPTTKTRGKQMKIKEQEIKYEKHTYRVENGKLIVYGYVKVAEYELATVSILNKNEQPDKLLEVTNELSVQNS